MPDVDQAPAAPPARRTQPGPSPLHSRIRVPTFLSLQILATLFPLGAGFAIFGWRAVGTTGVVVASAMLTMELLRRVGWRGRQARMWHCLWLAIMVALMLPPHLFTLAPVGGVAVWPILPAAGITLALLCWLLGGLGSQRVPPSVVTVLVLFAFFHQYLTPQYVLRVDRLFIGDLLDANPAQEGLASQNSWLIRQPSTGYDSERSEPPGDVLLAYTSAQSHPERASITMPMLIRDQLPPLENLIIGGESAAIGNASAIAIIAGGLFLLFQGMIDFRVPLLGTAAAMVSFMILPIPVLITQTTTDWRWFAFREHYFGWATATTFMNYEIFCSPLLLTLFYLATVPGLRPITRSGRVIFAVGLGILSAVFQLYASAAMGPYIALLAVTLLTPTLDRAIRPRTLL